MFLQGNLQTIFDALFHMGVIDPVLEKDWAPYFERQVEFNPELEGVLRSISECPNDLNGIITRLSRFDTKTLEYLAMEVAREFADYQQRQTLH